MWSIHEHLAHLATVLREAGDSKLASRVDAVLTQSDADVGAFIQSNELWGGAGSIADQAGMAEGTRTRTRRRVERALIDLGREQVRINKLNPRTLGWVKTFERWAEDRI
jgi:hypothetical protein